MRSMFSHFASVVTLLLAIAALMLEQDREISVPLARTVAAGYRIAEWWSLSDIATLMTQLGR